MRIAAALFGLFFAAPLFATVIVQKNGDVISGRILEEKEDKYVFQSPYGKLQISKANVAKLILDEKTLELKNVQVGEKIVKARLVNQENNTSVYLTEDGRTIRKEEGPEKEKAKENPPQIEVKRDSPRDRFLVAASGLYGLSTFQRESTDAAGGTMPPLNQSLHASSFGLNLSAHYALYRFMGLGVHGAFMRSVATAEILTPNGAGSHDSSATNTSVFAAPSFVFSFLGNLGSTMAAHDLRVEIQGGLSLNSADMQITFKNSAGFPGTASASGKNQSFAVGSHLYYCYSFSESFRLRLGLGYYRAFFKNIYDPTLQSPTAFPGAPGTGFKADLENNLSQPGNNPQIISLVLGAEVGF